MKTGKQTKREDTNTNVRKEMGYHYRFCRNQKIIGNANKISTHKN